MEGTAVGGRIEGAYIAVGKAVEWIGGDVEVAYDEDGTVAFGDEGLLEPV